MSLKSRLEKVERKHKSKSGMKVVQIPYGLMEDEEAKEQYLREHYPEAVGFSGTLIEVAQFDDVALE